MDITKHNTIAWNKAGQTNLAEWATPVSAEIIAKARQGLSSILLTNTKAVPQDWYMPIKGKKVLCLASGGGQQAPVLAALGAKVTLADISESQLNHDRMVNERDKLNMEIINCDMHDLSQFAAESFDLIFHPISNCFIPNPEPVWQQCYRVLKKGGLLLAGFVNPVLFIFDMDDLDNGLLTVANKIPYSDLEQLKPERLKERLDNYETLEFGHSLESLIGGQTKLGFAIIGFYEDICQAEVLDKHICSSIATKAIKL